jgi:hypothetical protein
MCYFIVMSNKTIPVHVALVGAEDTLTYANIHPQLNIRYSIFTYLAITLRFTVLHARFARRLIREVRSGEPVQVISTPALFLLLYYS